MFNEFPDPALDSYITKLASLKAYYNGEAHTHGFLVHGRYINATPEPEVIIEPPREEEGKKIPLLVLVRCPMCNLPHEQTTEELKDQILSFKKEMEDIEEPVTMRFKRFEDDK